MTSGSRVPSARSTITMRDMHGMQYTRSPALNSRTERITTLHTGQMISLGASVSPSPCQTR